MYGRDNNTFRPQMFSVVTFRSYSVEMLFADQRTGIQKTIETWHIQGRGVFESIQTLPLEFFLLKSCFTKIRIAILDFKQCLKYILWLDAVLFFIFFIVFPIFQKKLPLESTIRNRFLIHT